MEISWGYRLTKKKMLVNPVPLPIDIFPNHKSKITILKEAVIVNYANTIVN